MANIDDLVTLLKSQAALINNQIDQLFCLSLIDRFGPLWAAVAALETGGDIASYTINGRSFSKRDLSALREDMQILYAQIQQYLYFRGIVYDDSRYPLQYGRGPVP